MIKPTAPRGLLLNGDKVMVPNVADALAALREFEGEDAGPTEPGRMSEVFAGLAGRPVPGGLLRRIWALGGLQVQIVRAYLAYGIRSRFVDVDQRELERARANLRAALGMVTSMGYLRGAAMKFGQALTNLPDILPDEIVDALETLHFEAPPMHFTLLREQVRSELGRDPEDVFAEFDTQAFAAASLGQVHRARLRSGESLAVNIQYPGIGRAIRADFRTISALVFPLRLSRGWDRLKAQLDDVRKVVETETDYEREAETLRTVRRLFAEDDEVVVPRVFDEFSTKRVLAMEFIEGVHLRDFLAGAPSQPERDHFGRLIYLAQSRLHYSGKLLYSDPSPGNFLFRSDGTLGFIDFGCVRPYNDVEWGCCRLADQEIQRGDVTTEALRQFAGLAEGESAPAEHLALLGSWSRWTWRPYWHGGLFDFGDARYLREGVEILEQFYSERFMLGVPMAVFTTRWYLATVALLYRLGAHVNVRDLYVSERSATGWRES
jgi:aarF domain-containing kinase